MKSLLSKRAALHAAPERLLVGAARRDRSRGAGSRQAVPTVPAFLRVGYVVAIRTRVGVRNGACDPSLASTRRPSSLTPPPSGEGDKTGGMRAFFVASIACMSLAHAQPAPDAALEARVKALSSELRCLVCQNQTVEDSSAPVARDMKDQVRAQLAAGKSEAEVKVYMTERFGDFVLYKPPLKAATIVLWAGPFIALAVAGLLLVRRLRRTSTTASAAPLNDLDRERARALLNDTSKP